MCIPAALSLEARPSSGRKVARHDRRAAAAERERKPDVARFAEHIKRHIEDEETLEYPTVILVGEYLKLRMNGKQ